MLNYTGYYNKSDDDLPSDCYDLLVKSCGHYKLIHLPQFQTIRTNGRHDYQLLYVAEGIAHFVIKGTKFDVGKGGVVLYKPEEPQYYEYKRLDKPDIYWIHFTGRKTEQYLETLGLTEENLLQLHSSEDLPELFEKIITELRMSRYLNTEMSEAFFRQLLISISRSNHFDDKAKQPYNSLLDEAINYFNREYQSNINISEYATNLHISCSWFIREYKRYTGYSPKQYITNLRIQHAKELLYNRYLSVNDVSSLVGYENQLYFSRIFRKNTGMSPSEYRDKDGF
ncbi:MAG: helix-turn-helix transcriptional regulator [Mobilitalea sp.]